MKYLFLGLVSLLALSASAQEFPTGWEGTYSGELIIGHASSPGDRLGVDFVLNEIVPDSSWSYTMTYNSSKFGEIVKDYVIRKKNTDSTAYILDELDGIEIEMTLMDDCFYDFFEVMDTYYTSTLRKNGDALYFDLFIASSMPTLLTSSEPDEEGNIYEVKSYKPTQHQSVHLTKQ
ncbi:MAG: hypothetical protein ACI837_000074 [Crocinitomicaceae bacterium]|jgi:hypothetical protein